MTVGVKNCVNLCDINYEGSQKGFTSTGTVYLVTLSCAITGSTSWVIISSSSMTRGWLWGCDGPLWYLWRSRRLPRSPCMMTKHFSRQNSMPGTNKIICKFDISVHFSNAKIFDFFKYYFKNRWILIVGR